MFRRVCSGIAFIALVVAGCGSKSDKEPAAKEVSKAEPKPKAVPKAKPKAQPEPKAPEVAEPEPEPAPVANPAPVPKVEPTPPKRQPLGEPKFKLTVDEFVKEARTDKKATTDKYAGAVVEVSGFIHSHHWDTKTSLEIDCLNSDANGTVNCRGADPSDYGKLFTRRTITVKGRMKGIENLGYTGVILEDSEVTDLGPAPKLKIMTSREFATAAAADATELARHIGRETLFVTGKVVRVFNDRLYGTTVELEGDGKVATHCRIHEKYAKFFAPQFKPGETVTFIGDASPLLGDDGKTALLGNSQPIPKR